MYSAGTTYQRPTLIVRTSDYVTATSTATSSECTTSPTAYYGDDYIPYHCPVDITEEKEVERVDQSLFWIEVIGFSETPGFHEDWQKREQLINCPMIRAPDYL